MTLASIEGLTAEQAEIALQCIEYCYEQGWTDGLPTVPALERVVREFVEYTGRDAQEVVAMVPHLERRCTVELAAVNAVMAGCQREHFPVVLAAIEAFDASPGARWAWPQSTTGQTQLVIVNGPVRGWLGFNSRGNLYGSGFRANATVGRAVRLITLNALGIRPHEFDQSTQASPSKYAFCIAENEEDSPWEPLQVELGLGAESSVVTGLFARSTLHVENRQSNVPEEVLLTIADAMSYAGAGNIGRGWVVVMGPEHAQLAAGHGWSKADTKRFLWEHWGRRRGDLRRLGLSHQRVGEGPDDEFVRFGESPDSLLLIVAGANNAGVSSVISASTVPFSSKAVAEPRG